MMLWAILTIMTSVGAVSLAAPFLRRLNQRPESAYDIEVYCDQLAELEKKAGAGLIDGEQAAAARTEIKGRIIAAGRGRSTSLARFSTNQRNAAAAAISAIIILGSVGLYALSGSPDVPASSARIGASTQAGPSAVDQLAAATAQIAGFPQEPSQSGLGSVDEMIERLIERLNRSPNDPEGWRMLGWSYFNTQRFAQAASAYARAIELNPQSADFRSSRGEALVGAADGIVTDEAKAVFTEALGLDPKDPRARFFVGLAKEQAGNKPAALDDWIAILNETDSNEAWVGDLEQRVAKLGRETGADVSKRLHLPNRGPAGDLLGMLAQGGQAVPKGSAPNLAPSNTGAPSAEDIRNAEAAQPADRMAMIRTMVDRLASRLRQSPRDVDGWIRLMRSRQVLGDEQAAERTFRFALDVFKDEPQEQARISTAARELGLMK
jgi:cytochrome c-type biogenesis protein CcmH